MNEYIYKTSNENRFSETGKELPCFCRSKYPDVEWECGKKEGLSRPWGGKGGQRRGLAPAEHGLYIERPWGRSSRNRKKAGKPDHHRHRGHGGWDVGQEGHSRTRRSLLHIRIFYFYLHRKRKSLTCFKDDMIRVIFSKILLATV